MKQHWKKNIGTMFFGKKILGQCFEVRGALLHVSSEFNKCNIGWLIDRLDKVSW